MRGSEFLSGGQIRDDTGIKIHLHLIASLDCLACLLTLNNGKSDIDGIAVENSGKGGGNDTAYPSRLDSDGSMFSGRTTSKVFLCHDDVAFFHLMDKLLVNILHAVGCQFCGVRGIQISCRDDTLSPNLKTCPFAAFICFSSFINLTQRVRKSFRLRHWLLPPQGLPDKPRNPHDPYVLQSYGWWWKHSALRLPEFPYNRPGRDHR